MNKIDIIIVTFNSSSYIGNCLKSLSEHAPEVAYELYIVDNKSQDDTVAKVKAITATWGNVHILEPNENLGFAKANNLAVKAGSSPIVLLLNPDTVLKNHVLGHMANLLSSGQADIAGPGLLNEDGSVQRWAGGFFPTIGRALRHYFFIADLFKSGPLTKGIYVSQKDKKPMDVDWICGAFLMFKRSLTAEIGMLREDFFMYGEDMEFCYRAKKIGRKVLYDPTVNIFHLYGKSLSAAPSKVDHQSLANASTFFKEIHGPGQGKIFDLITFVGFGSRWMIYKALSVFSRIKYADRQNKCAKLTKVAWQIFQGAKTA